MTDPLGMGLEPGDHHYRAFVGAPDRYDILGALQFNLLTSLGLREHHSLLDIGCGSLRAGRLFIPYLLPGNYYGVEPEQWLVDEAIKNELGADLIRIKRPSFRFSNEFRFSHFGPRFDYLLAQSIFTHAARSQISACLTSARQVMHDNSLLVANYLWGDHDHEGTGWTYPGCVTYTQHTMTALAQDHGFSFTAYEYPHPAGVSWILLRPRS
jgi:cyclopropane fatty-acyl-phospholipid synthase-like methyltransferase